MNLIPLTFSTEERRRAQVQVFSCSSFIAASVILLPSAPPEIVPFNLFSALLNITCILMIRLTGSTYLTGRLLFVQYCLVVPWVYLMTGSVSTMVNGIWVEVLAITLVVGVGLRYSILFALYTTLVFLYIASTQPLESGYWPAFTVGQNEVPSRIFSLLFAAGLAVLWDKFRTEQLQVTRDLSHALADRLNDLGHANQELEAFSYSVSHDLRGSLRVIDGYSAELQNADELSPRNQEDLARIRGTVQRMSRLIDGLLTLSRITKSLKRERVNLSDYANERIEELAIRDPERTFEVQIEPNLYAAADPALVSVVLQNLLDNAWKFSSERSISKIAFGREELSGRAAFFVRDNGDGFDPSQSERMFKPFQRLHAESEFEGLGIGLATVRRAVRHLGGDVWAHSNPQQGTTFWFTIPESEIV